MGAQLDTWQLVEAPTVVPLPYGLFSVAEPRLTTDEHWRLGIRWQSQACAETKVTTGVCIDSEVEPLTPDDYCSVTEYEPFTVYAYNNDAVPGYTLEEHRANAIQRLINTEQRSAESQVWANMGTAPTSTTALAGYTAGEVLGYLEQVLAETYGGQGVIHMNRQTASFLWEYLFPQGGRLVTRLGTPVVAGAGYEQVTAPPSNDFTLYATGPLVIYRGDIDTRENSVDRAINEVSIVAQRDYVVGWDCVAHKVTAEFVPTSR